MKNELERSLQKKVYAGLVLWWLINLVQAHFTEIHPDEAYYALWAEHTDAGYYDHPPMVAFFIRISSFFFSGNLGVRFFTVLMQPITLFIVWQLCKGEGSEQQKRLPVFFITGAAMIMFSAYGFITTPDVPLLFFTAVFLWAYQRFLHTRSIPIILLLSVAMAGMICSKYQGAIVILMLIVSNIRLLTVPTFWIAGILALAICTPHFYWQIEHQFPSFKYHLTERSAGFRWNYFFEYLPNQMATFNPFVLAAMVWLVIRFNITNLFDRALVFIMSGMVLLFWLATFKGHAEPHWTVAASIPALILIVKYSTLNKSFLRYIRRVVAPSILLLIGARICLIAGWVPSNLELTGKQAKYRALEKVAGDAPVIIVGSFQPPSLYHYFTGREAMVLSSLDRRRTQFDIWRNDRAFTGKKVFVLLDMPDRSVQYDIGGERFSGFFVNRFQSTHDIWIRFLQSKSGVVHKAGRELELILEVENRGTQPFLFQHPELPATIHAVLSGAKGMQLIQGTCSQPLISLQPGEKKETGFRFVFPKGSEGTQKLGITCYSIFGPDLNSDFFTINIQP